MHQLQVREYLLHAMSIVSHSRYGACKSMCYETVMLTCGRGAPNDPRVVIAAFPAENRLLAAVWGVRCS